MKQLVFTKVTQEHHFKEIELLANRIWFEHYTPIIGREQVEYMLEKFQSITAMTEQTKQGYQYYQLSVDNTFVGYLSFLMKTDTLFLSKIYLEQSVRGQGLARQAINFLQEQAQSHQLKSIQLTVNKYNSDSIAAYQKMGFLNKEAIVMDIGNGFVMDDYLMELPIDSV